MAIICQCAAVRDRAVVKAIHRGATTLDDIRTVCGAATGCGGCEMAIAALLDRHAGADAKAEVTFARHGLVGA